jgi:hypothetical protein
MECIPLHGLSIQAVWRFAMEGEYFRGGIGNGTWIVSTHDLLSAAEERSFAVAVSAGRCLHTFQNSSDSFSPYIENCRASKRRYGFCPRFERLQENGSKKTKKGNLTE